jgi:hypothetical protein
MESATSVADIRSIKEAEVIEVNREYWNIVMLQIITITNLNTM